MNEKQIEKLAQELSEEELNELASGKMDAETKKKVLKYVGIGVGSAVALTSAGIGIAALVGYKTGKGAFSCLHSAKSSGDDTDGDPVLLDTEENEK